MLQRLRKEWQRIERHADERSAWMRLLPRDELKLDVWDLYLMGPAESLYAGGEFHFVMSIPAGYPFNLPHLTCMTPIMHPNIVTSVLDSATGKIIKGGYVCLPSDWWTGSMFLDGLAFALISMLADPNFDASVNVHTLYKRSSDVFATQARAWTRQHALLNIFVTPAQLRQVCIDTTLLLPELVWSIVCFVHWKNVPFKQ
jgi:ubiquitin-protein ligase